MKLLIILAICSASFSAFSDETCNVGYTCENAGNGEFIVRQTTLVSDHNLKVCQVMTVMNLGANENTCDQIAADLNNSL